MTTKEKLELIEQVLRLKPGSLTEATELNTLREWDSFTILGLQVRLTAINPDLQFNDLFRCDTVGEICELI